MCPNLTNDVEIALNYLKLDAESPCTTSETVLTAFEQWNIPIGSNTSIALYMPECGSAYNELRVVTSLISTGYNIRRCIFMDSRADLPKWKPLWDTVAEALGIQITTASSYESILDTANNEHITDNNAIVVFYINGALRFAPMFTPRHSTPKRCRCAAIEFWTWCQHAALNGPVNFLGSSLTPALPGGATTWAGLAEVFTYP